MRRAKRICDASMEPSEGGRNGSRAIRVPRCRCRCGCLRSPPALLVAEHGRTEVRVLLRFLVLLLSNLAGTAPHQLAEAFFTVDRGTLRHQVQRAEFHPLGVLDAAFRPSRSGPSSCRHLAATKDDNKHNAESPRANFEHPPVDASSDDSNDDNDDQLIDSFLRGDYDYEISDDAPSPHPGLSPSAVVHGCLESLRSLDDPTPSHGAAVLQRFLLPLSRRERWGDFSAAPSSSRGGDLVGSDDDPWRNQIMRGALTPHLLARQIRSSTDFGCLLDWRALEVTDCAHGGGLGGGGGGDSAAATPGVAHVNVALYFEAGTTDAARFQFTLRRIGGVWLIDTARRTSLTR